MLFLIGQTWGDIYIGLKKMVSSKKLYYPQCNRQHIVNKCVPCILGPLHFIYITISNFDVCFSLTDEILKDGYLECEEW